MSIPKTTKAWTIQGENGFDSLIFDAETPIPELAANEVLVKIHAASLNYRDLMLPKGLYPIPKAENVVPGSDGAGEVIAIGSKVTRFTKGSKVVTLFNQGHLAGSLDSKTRETGLGGAIDGTLRQYGIFNEHGLSEMPTTLSYLEASTLSCAALTAWNSFYGLNTLRPGQYVLVQGTGGVSIFALQFAKAAGAKVIATTSSAAKAEVLKRVGADHVINYKETADWGKVAKALTPKGEGVDHVLEVGGPSTMAQTLQAIKIDGIISIIGFLGGFQKDQPGFLDCLSRTCTVRGVFVGSRIQLEEMNRAIDVNNIKPIVDEKVFALEELKE
ncbi:hypothetical protein B7494_g7613 [Chlorociboria aeruginascens]|nr:hypothetical protein B7494_g7613 [Chlorociboria aeruginascens]